MTDAFVQRMSPNCDEVAWGLTNLNDAYLQERILAWLSPVNSSIEYNESRKKRHPDTCQWLCDDESYRSWIDGAFSVLWLQGISGCGKTILTSHVIDQLRDQGEVLFFFYFNINTRDKKWLSQMLRALVTQVQPKNQFVQDALRKFYASCLDGSRQPTLEQLCGCFKSIINLHDSVTIVIDALDECKEREALLDWLKELYSAGPKHLRLFVTSRQGTAPQSTIDALFPKGRCQLVAVRYADINADIASCVHSSIHHDKKFKHWNRRPELCLRMEQRVCEQSDGM